MGGEGDRCLWVRSHPALLAGHCQGTHRPLKVRPLPSPWSQVGVEPAHSLPQPQPARAAGVTPPGRRLPLPSVSVHPHRAGPAPEGNGQVFRAGEELIEAAKRNNFCKVPARAPASPLRRAPADRTSGWGRGSLSSVCHLPSSGPLGGVSMVIAPFHLAPVQLTVSLSERLPSTVCLSPVLSKE